MGKITKQKGKMGSAVASLLTKKMASRKSKSTALKAKALAQEKVRLKSNK